MTRDRAKTVKAGDLVSYQGKDNLIEIREVYETVEETYHHKIPPGTKIRYCTRGAVIENHNEYEIHQRKGSTYKNPFKLRDKVMTNGNMYEFDLKLKSYLDKGFISLEPGQHGIVEGIDEGKNKVLVAFNNRIWLLSPDSFGSQRPNKLWIDCRSLAFTDKPTPRVYSCEEELLLLI